MLFAPYLFFILNRILLYFYLNTFLISLLLFLLVNLKLLLHYKRAKNTISLKLSRASHYWSRLTFIFTLIFYNCLYLVGLTNLLSLLFASMYFIGLTNFGNSCWKSSDCLVKTMILLIFAWRDKNLTKFRMQQQDFILNQSIFP